VGLARTAESATLEADGSLVVEFYDFSDEADSLMGHELVTMIVIDPQEQAKMLALLAAKGPAPEGDAGIALLHLVRERFRGYFSVKEWCEAHGVAFTQKVDHWP
jgi:hypothetical protein